MKPNIKTMKPHIQLSIPEYGHRVWLCAGMGGLGRGHNPTAAFQSWERDVHRLCELTDNLVGRFMNFYLPAELAQFFKDIK